MALYVLLLCQIFVAHRITLKISKINKKRVGMLFAYDILSMSNEKKKQHYRLLSIFLCIMRTKNIYESVNNN